ncbi:XRE family transcriptional regulator [Streptomyces sp. AcE210]|uniref:XRE family transcriptional regulator n=1 Tax=Streptomyces sp. AcE210 TaxID=2292703 RepID=UPI000E302008|nr:XRE family transcriptional regulator [Streptomyces sp. AcE210]RFC72316.1 ImmA/IrrE family metallo-endopeptidase [Streptomyces sp. AcE210]
MASIPALVEPAVMRWARESVGLSPLAAARKFGVSEGRVTDWESGTARPTIAQLRKAAEAYKRPLAVFFLAEPPTTFDTLRDFRRHEGAIEGEWSPELHGEYRRALQQRQQLVELYEIDDRTPSHEWQISLLPESDEELAQVARQNILNLMPGELPANGSSPYTHLNLWISGLEEAGVLVLATSGGKVSPKEMRALSLHFEMIPVIMVNGADSARGRLFSLLHEYAHLLLHTSGLCDTTSDLRAVSPNRRLEARCNAIAASILMPKEAVLRRPQVRSRGHDSESWDYETLRSAAAPFGVSAEAFLRRLVTLGRVDRKFYNSRRNEFIATYEEEEKRNRPAGGNWYRNTVRDLGKGYVRQVADAHKRRVIDSFTAASYLDAKVGQIPKLAEKASIKQGVE